MKIDKKTKSDELTIANKELVFQNNEKEKRAAELVVANYARSLIEASLDPLVTISATGKILDVNEASVKVTGVPREKLIDTDFSNYFTEPTKAQEGYRRVFEKGFVADYSLTIKHKNGNLTDVLYNASVYKDDKGKVLGVFAAARDVTEQKWAKDLRIANKELAFQNDEKEKRAAELIVANKELAFQNDEKEKRAAELIIANKELAFQNDEKEKRAAELSIANDELAYQNNEKEKRAAELSIANIELAYQNEEKEKRAQELTIANKELAFQNKVKEKRAAELVIANEELAFQNEEKEKRAAELIIANRELAFQNKEKEKRAAELAIANKELAYQNKVKEKKAAELIIANKELAFQNDEKEKRAAELAIANKELAYQNTVKEKKAAELIVANKELAFQNDEKEKRAAELIIANKELAFQNDEKEKRAAELIIANKDLTAFTYVSSHDLQEPLRKIQNFATIILKEEEKNLSENGKGYFEKMQNTAKRMQELIEDLLTYSRAKSTERNFEKIHLGIIIDEAKRDLEELILEKKAIIESENLSEMNIIPFPFRQLMNNLISNSLKFSLPTIPPHIIIKTKIKEGSKFNNDKLSPKISYCHITYTDNGIGFDGQYNERIFEVFQRLNSKEQYAGTGMGLAICKRIVENHNGIIVATGVVSKGVTFDIYIPTETTI